MPASTMLSIIPAVLTFVIVAGIVYSSFMLILSMGEAMAEVPVLLEENGQNKTILKKSGKCEYCKHTLSSHDKHCANCGAPAS